MSEPAVQVEGARELRAALAKLGEDLEDFKDTHADVASLVDSQAVGWIPSRTGALAHSGRPSGTKSAAILRYGGAGAPYANAVHWGTGPRAGRRGPHNIASNRFATDAASVTEPAWTELYFKAVEAKVDAAIARSLHT